MNSKMFYRQLRMLVQVIALAVLMISGCATTKPGISADEVRERAYRAFGDSASERDTGIEKKTVEGPGSTALITKGAQPEWIEGEDFRYPSSLYLAGVGYGPDRRSAEDRARAEIAKIFYSRIDSSNTIYEEYLQETSDRESKVSDRFSMEEITSVSTQKVLSGIMIAGIYQEKDIFYALAVLDRDQAEKILHQKIMVMDEEIGELFSVAQSQEDKLLRIRRLNECVRKFILRDAFNAELQIVGQSGKGIQSPFNFADIKEEMNQVLLRDFSVALSVNGTRAGEVGQALVEALNRKGFSLSDASGDAVVIIKGTVEIKPIDQGLPDWKFVRWKIFFDLVDKKSGSTFGSVNDTGREGHINLLRAEESAVRKICEVSAERIAGEISKYIFAE